MVIAIDGPAASGKGTLAKRLAAHYALPHLDTGLLYRAVAHRVMEAGARLEDETSAAAIAASLDPERLEEASLRGRVMGDAASIVSAHPKVRAALLDLQRRFAAQQPGAVLDGRDIGTVICPDARVKLFVTASAAERAARRHRELLSRGEPADLAAILDDIEKRDARDRDRATAPLRPADDAMMLDTTTLDADAAFKQALAMVESRIGQAERPSLR